MKLRFKIDQAAAFRRGIDAPKSIVTIEVDPATLPQDERDLLADRMDEIDVCCARLYDGKIFPDLNQPYGSNDWKPNHILVDGPAYEDLIKAVRADQERVIASMK